MNAACSITRPFKVLRPVAAVLLAVAGACSVGAAYLEPAEGDGHPGPVPPPRPPLPPPVVRPVPPSNPVGAWLRTVRVAPPYSSGGLTVFPLVRPGSRWESGIATLEEALGAGWIEIREEQSPTVGALAVRNVSPRRVLLLAGESILGGKQNRILRNDVLLGPESGFVTVPVFCAEKERWAEESVSFNRAGGLAHPSLRRQTVAGASQNAVWEEIDAQSARSGVRSPTRDYQRIWDDPEIGREIDRCVAECVRRLPADVVGFVAADAVSILGCDASSDPDLFARLRDRILRGYAMEVVSKPGRRTWTRITVSAVEDYVSSAAASAAAEISAPGEGTLYRFAGEVDGQALVWKDRVVHAVFFGAPVRYEPQRPPVIRPFAPGRFNGQE